MSAEAKRVKILTLIELFLGVALVALGIVLLVTGAKNASSYVLCGEGVVSLVFGVRGALIANVPARIGKLVGFGLVILLLQLACVAGIVYFTGPSEVPQQPLPTCASVVPAIFTLIAVILARGMAKRAER